MSVRRRWLPAGQPGLDFYVVTAAAFALPGLVVGVLLANRPSPVLLIPVVAAAIPFTARSWGNALGLRLLSCGLFGITVVLGGFTIGILFLASAGMALAGTGVAASRRDRERPDDG